MTRFHFDLKGELPAHDYVGHECENVDEACEHGRFIAHRIGTEKPRMARPGNYISVRQGNGFEIYQAPIATTGAVRI